MICPHCRQQHPDGVRFCPISGQPLPAIPPQGQVMPPQQPAVPAACPNCARPVPPGVSFCPTCGIALTQAAQPPGVWAPASRPASRLRWMGIFTAGLLALSVILFAAYWFLLREPPAEEPAAIARETATVQPPTGSGSAQGISTTPPLAEVAPPTGTPAPVEIQLDPTRTPPPTEAASETTDYRTSTVSALLTRAAEAQPALTPTPLPTDVAEDGLIAFNSNRSGNNDIYVMYSDGSGVTQITSSAYDERVPAWSPDGREIAYQSNAGGDYEITVYDLETGTTRQVTNNSCDDYNPVFSPDGEWFAFYSDCDGNREIYKIRTNGTDRRQLTQTSGVYNWFPNWSPDGEQITFSSNRSGKYEVFVMDADGSDTQALARGCVSAFSPNGERLVFAQYCTDTGQIYLIRADGSNLRPLVEEEDNANPSWSPDGEWVLFQSEGTGNEEIWKISADGASLEQLTFDPGRDSAAVWQPAPGFVPYRTE